MLLLVLSLLALTRAEIIERMRAPVVTQADGFVQVYADCPEDMRREFQAPVGRFASDTVKTLCRGLSLKPQRFKRPALVVHLGDVRTNVEEVITRVATNDARVLTRVYLTAPGYANLTRFRMEVIKAFCRSVRGREFSDAEAVAAYRAGDPRFRVADERARLDRWLERGEGSFDAGLKMLRKIVEPGVASQREVLLFASRLFLYPPQYDMRFLDRYECLSFREALAFAPCEPRVRLMAQVKANELPVLGGGRGDAMTRAADSYRMFLLALAEGEMEPDELTALLDTADKQLNVALEEARKREGA